MLRKLLLNLLAITTLALSLVSCSEEGAESQGETSLPSPLLLEILDTTVDGFSAEIYVNGSQDCGKYVVGVVSEQTYADQLTDDDKLALYMKSVLSDKGVSFVRTDETYVFEGNSVVSLSKGWELKGSTTYVVVAYGVSSSGERTTQVASQSVTLDSSLSSGDGTLIISTKSHTATNINLTVEKSADALFSIYSIALVSQSDFESGYQSDTDLFATSFAKGLYDGGYDLTQANNYCLFDSSVSFDLSTYWDLESDCIYHIFAFGINADGSIEGELAIESTATTPFEDGYSIALDDITTESYTINLKATPESKVSNYCIYAVSESDLELIGYTGNTFALAKAVRDNLYYSGVSFSQPDNQYIFRGTVSASLTQLRSSTNYTIVSFGISTTGNITSEITCVEATTAAPPTVTGSLASIEVVGSYSRSFDVKIDKGDFSSRYYVGVYSKADFESYCNSNEYTLATLFMEDELYLGTDLTIVDNTWVFDESTTFNTEYSWICRPDTEYVITAFGVDAEGGVVSNVIYTMAKTLPVVESDNQIEISVHGITSNAATIKASPSNDDVYYFSYLTQAKADSMTDAQIVAYMEDQAGQFFQYFLSVGEDTLYTTTVLNPSTQYCAIGYGWDYAISTELYRVPFTTLEDIDAPAIPSTIELSDVAFGIVEITDVTYESYDLFVEPALEGMEYVLMTTAASNIAGLSSDEQIISYVLGAMNSAGASIQTGGDIYDAWGDYVKPLPIDIVQRASVISGYSYVMIIFGIDKATLQPTTECIVKNFTTPTSAPAASSAPAVARELPAGSPCRSSLR